MFYFLFFLRLAWSILPADSARWMRLKDTAVLLWTLARFACLLGCWLHFHPGAFSHPPPPRRPPQHQHHTHTPPPNHRLPPIHTHTTRNHGLFQTKIDGWNQSDMVLLFFFSSFDITALFHLHPHTPFLSISPLSFSLCLPQPPSQGCRLRRCINSDALVFQSGSPFQGKA